MKKYLLGFVVLLAAAMCTLYLSPNALISTVRFAERQVAGVNNQQISVDGLTIQYYEGGPTDAETILMIHGFGANRDNWLYFARPFTDRYHVIALDLPGFGESDKPDVSYDVGAQTERVQAFTRALGLKKLHLVGNSMGGHIAALYAARHPEQVLSVALLDNAGVTSPHKSEMFRRIEGGEANPLVVRKPEDFQTVMDFVFVNPPAIPASLKKHFAEQSMANSTHYDTIFAQLRDRYVPLEPELPKIQAPTLLLWGEQDRVLDVSSIDVMKPLLKKPSVVIMKDCGHAPMIERPEETAQHYQAFLDANQS